MLGAHLYSFNTDFPQTVSRDNFDRTINFCRSSTNCETKTMPKAESLKSPDSCEVKANVTILLHIVCNAAYDLAFR
jgi:hypothetical protein